MQSKQMSEAMITTAFLTVSGGLKDAYTYCCRGEVFANAQTGNIVLLGANLFSGRFGAALHYLLPILAFALGIFVAVQVRRRYLLHRRDRAALQHAGAYFAVIGVITLGAGLGAVLTRVWHERTIWLSCALLAVSFLLMFRQGESQAE